MFAVSRNSEPGKDKDTWKCMNGLRLEIGIDTMGQKPMDPKDAATKPTGNPGENGDPMGSV